MQPSVSTSKNFLCEGGSKVTSGEDACIATLVMGIVWLLRRSVYTLRIGVRFPFIATNLSCFIHIMNSTIYQAPVRSYYQLSDESLTTSLEGTINYDLKLNELRGCA